MLLDDAESGTNRSQFVQFNGNNSVVSWQLLEILNVRNLFRE